MNATGNITAQSVSAHLRRLGYRPNSDRNREAVRVSGGRHGAPVSVRVDFDAPAAATRMAVDVEADLVAAGYTVVRDDAAMFVTRP